MIGGLEGQVVGHPLADWSSLKTWRAPDPLLKSERADRDWRKTASEMAEKKKKGLLTEGWAERLFDRLYNLRGFENLMVDFAEQRPELQTLIDILTEYELQVVDQWIRIGVDVINFHTDIGTQQGLMISPASFRRYIKPMYRTLFQRCRRSGSLVHLSSDGRLLEIVDDLIECGVTIHDPQLRANTLEGLVKAYKGKLCARLDLDRQSFPFLTPGQLRDQVRRVVEAMDDPRGGLMIDARFYGPVPWRNVEALCESLEEFCFR
jgi:uroporphyrinogen decarboxylase